MSRPAIVALALSALHVLGCNTGTGGAQVDAAPSFDAMPSASCLEAADHSDLAWLQEQIFSPSCANFSPCHQGNASEAGGLNLEDGMTLANLVGVPSELVASMNLVEPGSPDDSYLMVILGQFGTDDPRIDTGVGTMPFNNPILCKAKRDAIARWINSLGAADAGVDGPDASVQ